MIAQCPANLKAVFLLLPTESGNFSSLLGAGADNKTGASTNNGVGFVGFFSHTSAAACRARGYKNGGPRYPVLVEWKMMVRLLSRAPRAVLLLSCGLLFSTWLPGQQLSREALSTFPATTTQVAYTNLAGLRELPNYALLRASLFPRPMRGFEELLKSVGVDPEKTVDSVIVGWRGAKPDAAAFFGLASGNFNSGEVITRLQATKLPIRNYEGYTIGTFGSGMDRSDLYFSFLSPSLAAFGRFNDLKDMLDVRSGALPALDSNADFVNWAEELAGSAIQWGITTGPATAHVAAGWLGHSAHATTDDLSPLLQAVRAVLYTLDWDEGFTTDLSLLCQRPDQAAALARLLSILQQTMASGRIASSPAISRFVQGIEIDADQSRVEIEGSGDTQAIRQLFQGLP